MAKRGVIKIKVNRSSLRDAQAKLDKAAEEGMNKIVTDLLRVSSEAAPFEEGDLERAGEKAVFSTRDEVIGVVGFEVYNRDFEYATWIHEDETYNLQEGSLMKGKKPAKGMSGRTYAVDRKYMSRPLYGEANTYKRLLEEEVEKAFK